MAERTGGTGVWRGPQALAAVAVLVVGLVWRSALTQGSFFNQDDYYLTSRAYTAHLTWRFLFSPVAGHVQPAQQLSYWAVAHAIPFNWPAIAFLLIAAQAIAALVMWHLLTRLLPDRWARVPLLAVLVWSPLTLATSLWWSAAMGLWPVVLCTLVAVLLLVRAHQGAGRRWANLLGCVLAVIVGLLWHERAVIIAPLLMGVAIVLSEAVGWRRVPDAIRSGWQLWLGLAALLAGYLVLHTSITSVGGKGTNLTGYLGISWNFVAENVVPGLASGPWSGHVDGGAVVPDVWMVVAALLGTALLAAALVRGGGSRARWALIVLTGYVLADLVLLLSGRAGYGSIIGQDPRYSADIVPVAVLCIALALGDVRADLLASRALPWATQRRLAVGGVLGAYLVGSMLGTAVLLPQFQNKLDRVYVTNLRAALAADPQQVLLDEPVPAEILLPLLGKEAMLSQVFRPLPGHPLFDAPSPELRQVDANGHLHEPVLSYPTQMRPGPVTSCGYAVTGRPTTIRLEQPVTGRAVVRVGYFTDTEVDIAVSASGWKSEFHANPGPNVVWLVVPDLGGPLSQLVLTTTASSSATVCIPSLEAGWPFQ